LTRAQLGGEVLPILDLVNVKVVSVQPDETVRTAIARMLESEVGAVAVSAGSELAGIFTERDVLRLAGEGADFDRVRVGDVMTTSLVTVGPDDGVLEAARLMGERRIRHLPVVEGGNVIGLVGIRDVLGALAERLWSTHDSEARETIHGLLASPRAAARR
jgi:CBS domain-containing protein